MVLKVLSIIAFVVVTPTNFACGRPATDEGTTASLHSTRFYEPHLYNIESYKRIKQDTNRKSNEESPSWAQQWAKPGLDREQPGSFHQPDDPAKRNLQVACTSGLGCTVGNNVYDFTGSGGVGGNGQSPDSCGFIPLISTSFGCENQPLGPTSYYPGKYYCTQYDVHDRYESAIECYCDQRFVSRDACVCFVLFRNNVDGSIFSCRWTKLSESTRSGKYRMSADCSNFFNFIGNLPAGECVGRDYPVGDPIDPRSVPNPPSGDNDGVIISAAVADLRWRNQQAGSEWGFYIPQGGLPATETTLIPQGYYNAFLYSFPYSETWMETEFWCPQRNTFDPTTCVCFVSSQAGAYLACNSCTILSTSNDQSLNISFDCSNKFKTGKCVAVNDNGQCIDGSGIGSLTPPPTPDPTATMNPTTDTPTLSPTAPPTQNPTAAPTEIPTASPTQNPTTAPTQPPTSNPTFAPTIMPTVLPTAVPTPSPTVTLTVVPTQNPTVTPTTVLTPGPTFTPTVVPTPSPTGTPTTTPTSNPTTPPVPNPTSIPTNAPTLQPTPNPTPVPTTTPTIQPTPVPSASPTTSIPSSLPSFTPSLRPSESLSPSTTSPSNSQAPSLSLIPSEIRGRGDELSPAENASEPSDMTSILGSPGIAVTDASPSAPPSSSCQSQTTALSWIVEGSLFSFLFFAFL